VRGKERAMNREKVVMNRLGTELTGIIKKPQAACIEALPVAIVRSVSGYETRNGKNYTFLITIAEAPPPPLQIPVTPMFPPSLCRIDVRVARILEPLLPSACPSATAPP
jgi:hypothetical protein